MNFVYNFLNNLTKVKDLLLFNHIDESGYIDGERFYSKNKKAIEDVFYDKQGNPVCKIVYSPKGIHFYENNKI